MYPVLLSLCIRTLLSVLFSLRGNFFALASGASQPVMTAAPLDDTEDASSVKGSALKRPVRLTAEHEAELTAMDGDALSLPKLQLSCRKY